MTPEDALQQVLSSLEEHLIHYMVTESFASNMHGVPRTTYDADIVIDASWGSLEKFLQGLQKKIIWSVYNSKTNDGLKATIRQVKSF